MDQGFSQAQALFLILVGVGILVYLRWQREQRRQPDGTLAYKSKAEKTFWTIAEAVLLFISAVLGTAGIGGLFR
jgi:hypothetical protein